MMWFFFTILLLLLVAGAYLYVNYYIPVDVYRLGTAHDLSYPQIKKLHNAKIPIVSFVTNNDKIEKAEVDIDETELLEMYRFYPDIIDAFINHIIDFKKAGIQASRDLILEHLKKGGSIDKVKDLRFVASKANLKIDLPALMVSGVPDDELRTFVDVLVKAHKAGLYVSKEELSKLDPETRTQLEESKISQQGLLGHYKAKIDIENYVDAMIRAKNSGIVISKETFNLQYVTDGDMLQLVESMIKLQQADLQVKEADLLRMKIVGGNMEKMADALIRIKISQLENVSVEELIQFHLIGGAVDDYVVALELVRNNHLDLVKQDIINHQLNGGDIVNFISAYAMNKNFRMGITRDELEIASVNGADVSEVLTIIRSTKDKPYEIDFQFAVELSNADVTPTEAIAWATVPKVVLVEPSPSIVTRNGIEILPKVTVTLRGKIENYFSHSREEVVFDRVREALITEMETFGTHEDILHNLEWISKRLLHQLQGRQEMSHTLYKPENEIRRDIDENDKKEQRLNEESAFELLDVSIADILIGKDIFEQLRMREAEYYKELSKKDSEKRISLARADEEEAKARLIKSRAQLHEGMAKGFESGKDLSKEYLKGEIFGYGDEIKKKEK